MNVDYKIKTIIFTLRMFFKTRKNFMKNIIDLINQKILECIDKNINIFYN